jgi:hypothetical protein
LICKGLKRFQTIYQQSYPQKSWMPVKSFMNQRLKRTFVSSHQVTASSPDIQAPA